MRKYLLCILLVLVFTGCGKKEADMYSQINFYNTFDIIVELDDKNKVINMKYSTEKAQNDFSILNIKDAKIEDALTDIMFHAQDKGYFSKGNYNYIYVQIASYDNSFIDDLNVLVRNKIKTALSNRYEHQTFVNSALIDENGTIPSVPKIRTTGLVPEKYSGDEESIEAYIYRINWYANDIDEYGLNEISAEKLPLELSKFALMLNSKFDITTGAKVALMVNDVRKVLSRFDSDVDAMKENIEIIESFTK